MHIDFASLSVTGWSFRTSSTAGRATSWAPSPSPLSSVDQLLYDQPNPFLGLHHGYFKLCLLYSIWTTTTHIRINVSPVYCLLALKWLNWSEQWSKDCYYLSYSLESELQLHYMKWKNILLYPLANFISTISIMYYFLITLSVA